MTQKIKDLHTNPIFYLLTKNAHPPLWRGPLIMVAAIAGGSIVLGVGGVTLYFLFDQVLSSISILKGISAAIVAVLIMLAVVFWLVQLPLNLFHFILPVIFASVAATMTQRIVSGDEHEILRTTLITPKSIIKGIMGAVFYRLRYVFALALGLVVTGYLISLGSGFAMALDDAEWIVISYTFRGLGRAVRTLGANPLGAAIGITMALIFRKDNTANIIAPMLFLIFEIGVWVLVNLLSFILMAVLFIDNISGFAIYQTITAGCWLVIRLAYFPAIYLLLQVAWRRV